MKPRRRWVRRTLMALAVVVVLGVLLVLALPSILSSSPGKRLALGVVNASIPGRAEVSNMSLGWFSGQHIEGLKLLDSEGQAVLSIRSIAAPDLGLWALLRGSQNYGTITLEGLSANIVEKPDGRTNLQQAISSRKEETQAPTDLGQTLKNLRTAVVVKQAEVTYQPTGLNAVRVAPLEARFSTLEPQVIQAQFSTNIEQGQDRGSVSGTLALRNLISSDGKLQPRQAQVQGQVDVSQLPVGAVDRLMNRGGALVELLGPVLEAHAQTEGTLLAPRAQVKASSANLSLNADLTVEDGAVVVAPQTGAELTITPAAFAAFTRSSGQQAGNQPQLMEPVRVELTVPKGRLVRGSDGLLDWRAGELVAQIRATDARVSGVGEDLPVVSLRNPSAQLAFDGQQQQVMAQFSAVAAQSGSEGPIRGEATVKYPLDAQGQPQWGLSQVEATAEAPRVPTALVDAAIGGQGLVSEALGPTISVNLAARLQPAQGQQTGLGSVQITAQAANLTQAGLTATVRDGRLIVQPGTLAELQVTPALVTRLAQQVPALEGVGLRQASSVAVAVRELSLPVQPLDLAQARVDVGLTVSPMALSGAGRYDAAMLGPLAVQAGPGLLGQSLPLVVEGQAARGQSQARVSLRGQVLEPLGTRVLQASGQVQAQLAPDFMTVAAQAAESTRVVRPVQAVVDVQQLRLPLGPGASMADASLQMTAQVPEAQLSTRIGEVGARNLRLEIQSPRLDESLQVKANGQFTSPQGGGSLDAQVQLHRPLDQRRQVTANVGAKSIPVAVLEAMTGDQRLSSLMGDRIESLDLQAQTQADAQIAFTAGLVSPQLKSNLAGTYKAGDFLRLKESPNALELELTPQAFAALRPTRKAAEHQPRTAAGKDAAPDADQPLELMNPARVTVAVGETVIGLRDSAQAQTKEQGAIDLTRVKLTARVQSSPIVLRRGSQPPFTVEGLDASVQTQDLRQELRINLKGEVVSTPEAAGQGVRRPIASDTRLLGLVNAQGAIDTAHTRVQTQTQLSEVPTSVAVAAIGADPAYVGAIGPTMTLQASGQVPGDLDVKLTSPNVKAPVTATITEDRRLRLRQDAVMQVAVTPELSQTLLKFGSPLLVDAQDSQQPIRLILRSEGFDVPLANFDLKQATLAADLELGTLRMKRGWARGSVEELVRTVAGALQARLPFEEAELEPMNFTPLQARLAQGVVTTNDVWMWNPTTAMGLQGQVDLVQGRMNMTMGLLGEALLRRIPALKGLRAIQPEQVYEFAARGPLSAPKVDFGKFATQVAMAVGIAEAGKQGGELGQVLGGVLGEAVQGGKGGPLAGARLSWPDKPTLPALEGAAAQMQQPAQEAQPSQPQQQTSEQPQQQQPRKRQGTGALLEGILQGIEQQQQQKQQQ